jgi:PAS domain S-box-containing protein
MMVTDTQRRILRVNRAFTEITGYLPEEVLGRTPGILSSGLHDRAFYAAMWQKLRSTGTWQGEIWNRRKSGDLYSEWLSISSIADALGEARYYVATFFSPEQAGRAGARKLHWSGTARKFARWHRLHRSGSRG